MEDSSQHHSASCFCKCFLVLLCYFLEKIDSEGDKNICIFKCNNLYCWLSSILKRPVKQTLLVDEDELYLIEKGPVKHTLFVDEDELYLIEQGSVKQTLLVDEDELYVIE